MIVEQGQQTEIVKATTYLQKKNQREDLIYNTFQR